MSSSNLPAEVLEIILSNLIPTDSKILWSRRYHPTRGLDIRLSLVSKSFKGVCDALFYSGNVFQFFNEDELSHIIDVSGPLISSYFRHIELMQSWSTRSLQPMTNTEKLRKWVDSAKYLKDCHNLCTLRIHHVAFSNWKLANDFDSGMHRIAGSQPDYVVMKLLNLTECPGAFYNGGIYFNNKRQEYTVIRKRFDYRSRPFVSRSPKLSNRVLQV